MLRCWTVVHSSSSSLLTWKKSPQAGNLFFRLKQLPRNLHSLGERANVSMYLVNKEQTGEHLIWAKQELNLQVKANGKVLQRLYFLGPFLLLWMPAAAFSPQCFPLLCENKKYCIGFICSRNTSDVDFMQFSSALRSLWLLKNLTYLHLLSLLVKALEMRQPDASIQLFKYLPCKTIIHVQDHIYSAINRLWKNK